MKQIAILTDAFGYTERRRALVDSGIEVVAVSPRAVVPDGYQRIAIPEDWLPARRFTLDQKHWFKSNTLALAAIEQLELDADAYWVIEGDCVAAQDRWKALFADHEDNTDDLCTPCLRTRAERPNNWAWEGCPPWANLMNLNAIHRISARAARWNIEAAVEAREILSDITTASVVQRAGGTLGRINRTTTHFNNQTMRAIPNLVLIDPRFINHPVKSNTYGVLQPGHFAR